MTTSHGRVYTRLESLVASLSLTEKIAFYGSLLISVLALLTYTLILNERFLISIPRDGGTLQEGFVGSPRFINPLLATTDTDRDLTSLIYSGLMRVTSDGTLIPNLASGYTVSEDGLTYVFTLREDAVFHDGKKITSADVVYTVHMAQDPVVKSPKRAQWEGVQVEAVNEREVKFTLETPYSAFLINTTLGILPAHLWQGVSAEELPWSTRNLSPIGSGPYKLSQSNLGENGLVLSMRLTAWSKFPLGKAHIKHFDMLFYPNETARLEALAKGEIDSAAGLSKEGATAMKAKNINLVESPLHRLFGIFFNQNQSAVLLHHEIRQALRDQVNKERLIDEVLGGYGTAIDSPIPQFTSLFSSIQASSSVPVAPDTKAILDTLALSGWSKNADGILEKKGKTGSEKLIFSIYTSDNPELKETAKKVSEMWNQIGAIVDVKVYESAQFNLGIIRPRKYDALLFGITVGRDLDYYAFWHSSQRNDPGLNISLYTNPKADRLLERARSENDQGERLASEEAFALEVMKDIPAVFLYSPHFIYALPSYVKGFETASLRAPGDRFYDVHTWYIETDKVWGIFAK